MMMIKHHVDIWLRGSSEDLRTMEYLLKGRKVVHAMFIGHLALEKMLKALCAVRLVPQEEFFTHNLRLLAQKAGLWEHLNADEQAELRNITTFNIEGRYEEYKSDFRALCTPKFTKHWAKIIRAWCKRLRPIVLQERALVPNRTPVP
ncbi:MAG: HEPN domain-containing protein [Clostridiales bacterium]|jgi:HEPN domain-containing protein|nr:HEPN domain-containing protein [Clostridiales bacterium]